MSPIFSSSNKCETSEGLLAYHSKEYESENKNRKETIWRLKILCETELFTIASICFENSDISLSCKFDKLDLFVWSRNVIVPSIEFKEQIIFLLQKYFETKQEQIVFRDTEESCLVNDFEFLTAELNIVLNNTLKNSDKKITLKRLKAYFQKINHNTRKMNESIEEIFNNFGSNSSIFAENFNPIHLEEPSDPDEMTNKQNDLTSVELEISLKEPTSRFKKILIRNNTHLYSLIDSNNNINSTTKIFSNEEEIDMLLKQLIDSDKKLEENNYFLTINEENQFKKENQTSQNYKDKIISKKEQFENFDNFNLYKYQKEKQLEDGLINQIESPILLINCKEISCVIPDCNYGRKKDENGCEICDCMPNPDINECNPPYCHPCFYGSYTDENGCESCACKPRPKPKNIYECPKLDCPSCNYGSIKDEYGCETCICIRPNSPSISYQCPPEPTCPFGTCKHGSILNDYGCATCECLKSSDPNRDECIRQRCQNQCQHGYFTDADGCESCICKPDWMAPCYLSEKNCQYDCEFGSYLDRNGCPSCECLPDPFLKISCNDFKNINNYTECDYEDGTFKPKQCNDQECRCVTPEGFPISDFKEKKNEADNMNCECALALYDASKYKAIGFKLYCSKNGNYENIQCVGASCACVNDHGDPLGPSVPIYQKHLLRCEGVYQRLYYDKYISTIPPSTIVPPLCFFHKEKALEMSKIDRHLSIPECDERGDYLNVQCDRHKKYCWCVNIHNGIELYGTRKIGERPICTHIG